MKALTLWQPWASLWAAGIKKNETRSWATKHRGPLLIHAAKTPFDRVFNTLGHVTEAVRFEHLCMELLQTDNLRDLPKGCIVGTVDVVGCYEISDCTFSDWSVGPSWSITGTDEVGWPGAVEQSLGDYSTGRYAWIGAHHRAFEPIPCRGGQRLWNVPPGVMGFDWTCPGCGTQNPSSNTHCSCELQYDRGMVDP